MFSLTRAGLLFFVVCVGMLMQAQNGEVLRQRYGAPIAETYLVRPGITVTATYAQDGSICEMLIKPTSAPESAKSPTQVLKSKELDEVLDELVPRYSRGKYLMGGFLNMVCLPNNDCGGTTETWEQVHIYRNGGVDQHRYASIRWETRICKSAKGEK